MTLPIDEFLIGILTTLFSIGAWVFKHFWAEYKEWKEAISARVDSLQLDIIKHCALRTDVEKNREDIAKHESRLNVLEASKQPK